MPGTPALCDKTPCERDTVVRGRGIVAAYWRPGRKRGAHDSVQHGGPDLAPGMWVYVPDMPAGPLVVLRFFPDQGDGMPHALHGMYNIIEVQ
jgi:hypothetical protein